MADSPQRRALYDLAYIAVHAQQGGALTSEEVRFFEQRGVRVLIEDPDLSTWTNCSIMVAASAPLITNGYATLLVEHTLPGQGHASTVAVFLRREGGRWLPILFGPPDHTTYVAGGAGHSAKKPIQLGLD
jgi:hypothetical protein